MCVYVCCVRREKERRCSASGHRAGRCLLCVAVCRELAKKTVLPRLPQLPHCLG